MRSLTGSKRVVVVYLYYSPSVSTGFIKRMNEGGRSSSERQEKKLDNVEFSGSQYLTEDYINRIWVYTQQLIMEKWSIYSMLILLIKICRLMRVRYMLWIYKKYKAVKKLKHPVYFDNCHIQDLLDQPAIILLYSVIDYVTSASTLHFSFQNRKVHT